MEFTSTIQAIMDNVTNTACFYFNYASSLLELLSKAALIRTKLSEIRICSSLESFVVTVTIASLYKGYLWLKSAFSLGITSKNMLFLWILFFKILFVTSTGLSGKPSFIKHDYLKKGISYKKIKQYLLNFLLN